MHVVCLSDAFLTGSRMTGQDLRAVRLGFSMSQEAFSLALGYSSGRHVRRLELLGALPVPLAAAGRVREFLHERVGTYEVA